MAEIAVAASAAGLASLGIQCCKGLRTYYSSFKAYDEQIGANIEQTQVLAVLFENLERVLSRNAANPARTSSLQRVDGILSKCRDRVERLRSVLEKCQSTTLPSGQLGSLQKIKTRALFPFRQQTLITVRENVESLRSNLQFALNISQMCVSLPPTSIAVLKAE